MSRTYKHLWNHIIENTIIFYRKKTHTQNEEKIFSRTGQTKLYAVLRKACTQYMCSCVEIEKCKHTCDLKQACWYTCNKYTIPRSKTIVELLLITKLCNVLISARILSSTIICLYSHVDLMHLYSFRALTFSSTSFFLSFRTHVREQ